MLTYLVLAGIVTLLFFTSQARHSRDPDTRSLHDFYSKTVNAMDKSHAAGPPPIQKIVADHDVDADGDIDDDDTALAREMAARVRQAEQKAKDSAQAKGPNKPETPAEVVGVGSSAGGQTKPAPKPKSDSVPQETEEDLEVKAVLNDILKKSPGTNASSVLLRMSAFADPRLSQSSSSPSRTAPTPSAPKESCSRSTTSSRRPTSSSWTCIPWGRKSKPRSER